GAVEPTAVRDGVALTLVRAVRQPLPLVVLRGHRVDRHDELICSRRGRDKRQHEGQRHLFSHRTSWGLGFVAGYTMQVAEQPCFPLVFRFGGPDRYRPIAAARLVLTAGCSTA